MRLSEIRSISKHIHYGYVNGQKYEYILLHVHSIHKSILITQSKRPGKKETKIPKDCFQIYRKLLC